MFTILVENLATLLRDCKDLVCPEGDVRSVDVSGVRKRCQAIQLDPDEITRARVVPRMGVSTWNALHGHSDAEAVVFVRGLGDGQRLDGLVVAPRDLAEVLEELGQARNRLNRPRHGAHLDLARERRILAPVARTPCRQSPHPGGPGRVLEVIDGVGYGFRCEENEHSLEARAGADDRKSH